ncbi:MAG: hypothetical protein IRZ03_14380 [Acidobacterium ailaaui]|nr:hypothetical protein [Pseudacidobacterium ailaaui]
MEGQALTISAVLGITLVVLGFLLKSWFNQIINRLDELVEEIKQLNHIKTVHDQQIKFLQENQMNMQNRLNDHGKRIRDLELKQR